MSNALTVIRKELLDAWRDKRSLFMLSFFVLLYPLMMAGMFQHIIGKITSADRETNQVIVIGGEQTPSLLQRLRQRGITVEERGDMQEHDIAALLKARDHSAIIRVNREFTKRYQELRPARVELWYDSARDEGAKLGRVQQVLREYGNDVAQARLLAHGVSTAVLAPVQVLEYDTATSASRSGRFLGAMFGVFFVSVFYFCLNMAIDTTAGERERRSLEILLAQPVAPRDLIVGKWLSAAALCAVGLSLELLVGHLLLRSIPLEEIGLSWRLSWPNLLLLIASALPLCMFAAAFEIALALNSKTFKEAQTAVSFALLLPLIPVIVVPMMDLGTRAWMYAVPVLAEQTLMLELAKGHDVPVTAFLSTMGVSLLAAAICLAFATWRLRSERFVLGV